MKFNLIVLALGLGASVAQAGTHFSNNAKSDPVVTSASGVPVMNFQKQCWTDIRNPGALDACIETAKPVAAAPAPAAPVATATPELKAHFASNQASLRKGDVAQIKKVANTYATIVRKQPNSTIKISGYADATGTDARNMKLSRDRAFAARQALVKAGVPAKAIQTEGFGAQDKSRLAQCEKLSTEKAKIDCLQVDRRAEISVQAR